MVKYSYSTKNTVPERKEDMEGRKEGRGMKVTRTRKVERLFSDSSLGTMHKIGYAAIRRHCDRYGLTTDIQTIADATQEALTELLEEGELTAQDFQQDKELRQETVFAIARKTVNAYRRFLHRSSEEETLSFILDEGEERTRYVAGHYPPADRQVEIKDMLEDIKDVLSVISGGYETVRCLMEGLTQEETAKALACSRKTIQRRINRIQDKVTTGYVFELTR